MSRVLSLSPMARLSGAFVHDVASLSTAEVARLSAEVLTRFVAQRPIGHFRVQDDHFAGVAVDDRIHAQAYALLRGLRAEGGPYAQELVSRLQRISFAGVPLASRYVARAEERNRAQLGRDVLFLPSGDRVEGWRPLAVTSPARYLRERERLSDETEASPVRRQLGDWLGLARVEPDLGQQINEAYERYQAGIDLSSGDRRALTAILKPATLEVEHTIARGEDPIAAPSARQLDRLWLILGENADRRLIERAYAHDILTSCRHGHAALKIDVGCGNAYYTRRNTHRLAQAVVLLRRLDDLTGDARELHDVELSGEVLRLAAAGDALVPRLVALLDEGEARLATLEGRSPPGPSRCDALATLARVARSHNPFRAPAGRRALVRIEANPEALTPAQREAIGWHVPRLEALERELSGG